MLYTTLPAFVELSFSYVLEPHNSNGLHCIRVLQDH